MRLFLCFLFLTCSGMLLAQSRFPAVLPGPAGVFVQATNVLHGPRYRIERLVAASGTWQEIAVTDSPPDSPAALGDRLRMLSRKHPTLQIPSDSVLSRVWKSYQRGATSDSLYGYGSYPLMLEAIGVAYMDPTTEPGQRYEYRVSPVGATADRQLLVGKPASVPGSVQPFGAKFVRAEPTGRDIRLTWLITRPTAFLGGARVQRGVYAQVKPADVPVEFGFRRGKKDSLLLEMIDYNVQKRVTYQYVLTPTDLIGNPGQTSDTATVTNLRPHEDLPVILSVAAKSAVDQGGIRLSWQLSGTRGLRSIAVLRATKYDGPYLKLTEVQPTDTTLIDYRVEPVQTYFYQLALNGTYDQLSESVRFPGLLNASRPALSVPLGLKLTQTAEAITLTWRRNGTDTRGYYIFRGNTFRGPLQRVSDVIETRDSLVRYVQKISELTPSAVYSFAVAGVNTSYRTSLLSDTVYSQAVVPSTMATPLGLVALRSKTSHAQLVWEDLTKIDPYVQGYIVQRKAPGETAFRDMHRQTFGDVAKNNYTDTTTVLGRRYAYRILAYGLNKVQSAPSAETTFYVPLPPALTPLNLRVIATTEGTVVLWDAPITPNIQSFKLFRSGSAGKPVEIATLNPTFTKFEDKSVKPGQPVFYQIALMDKRGQLSPLSDAVGVEW